MIKYVRSHFVILDVRAHTLLAYTTSPKVRAHRFCFLKKICQRYILQITINQRTRNKVIKEINYCTKLSENAKSQHQEEPWDRVCDLTVRRDGIDNFVYLNSSFSLFYFYSVRNLWKKIFVAYIRLQLTRPSPLMSLYAFSCTTPSLLWA